MKKLYVEKLVKTVTILGSTATLTLSDESGNKSTVSGLIPSSQPFISDDLNPTAHNLFQLVKNCAAGLVTNDPEEQLLFRDMTLRDFKNGYVIGNQLGAHITLNTVDWIGDILSMGGKERSEPFIITHFSSEGAGISSTCVIQATHKGTVYMGRRMTMLESFNIMLASAFGGQVLREMVPSGRCVEVMVEMFNVQLGPDFVPSQMYTKEAAAILAAIYNNTPKREKETKVKDNKIAKLTLQEIDTNSNGDWTVKVDIDQFTRPAFSIKFIVTSRNNSEHLTRTDGICVLRQNVINSLPLTLETEDKLKAITNDEWHAQFDFKIAKDIKCAFPNTRSGVQMLGLINWFQRKGIKDSINHLMEVMFDREHTWDPETQGMKNISGKAEGGEVSFRVCHAVGNHFVEGNLETVKLRVFKTHSTIQAYVRYDGNEWAGQPTTFNITDTKQFEEWLRFIVKSEIEYRKSQSK